MSDGSDLVFVALGGAGEIGMNMYLYGHGQGAKRRWIMVDCGVGFGDMETSPGIELVMADPSFIAEQADKLVGIEEAGVDPACLNIVQVGETIEAGPFKVSFQPVTHSIPEASSLVIDTPSGRVVHTGDFKFDDNPQIGAPFDLEAFRAIGSTGVQAMICDSTNVFLNGHGGSESEVVKPLADLIRTAKGAVAATTFASNVARLRSIAVAAEQCGRAVVLVGRARGGRRWRGSRRAPIPRSGWARGTW